MSHSIGRSSLNGEVYPPDVTEDESRHYEKKFTYIFTSIKWTHPTVKLCNGRTQLLRMKLNHNLCVKEYEDPNLIRQKESR